MGGFEVIFKLMDMWIERTGMDAETLLRSGFLGDFFPGLDDPKLVTFVLQAYSEREKKNEAAARAQREKEEKERQAVRYDMYTIMRRPTTPLTHHQLTIDSRSTCHSFRTPSFDISRELRPLARAARRTRRGRCAS